MDQATLDVMSIDELKILSAQVIQTINTRTKEQRDQAVTKVQELLKEHGLTMDDLQARAARKESKPVLPKYRNPETGQTWTGRGVQPRWIRDKNRDDFLIK